MGRYVIRRLLLAIPTLIAIGFVIFTILDLAPGDPTANLPLNIPPEVREQIRQALGLGEPFLVRWLKWMQLMFINEPLHIIESIFNICIGDCDSRIRIVSWAGRAPALDIIWERLPQTLWVMGFAFVIGVLIAIPVGVISAYKQYSWFDNIGTFFTMIGYSVPTFFTGLVAIVIFAVKLKWFPSFYDTRHVVDWTDWDSIVKQFKQMVMPVTVLSLFNAAALTRFTRAAVLDNLNEDYVRTARSKGLAERPVVTVHVLRNSMIPVITLIALQVPGIFAGAIITEQIFRINGMGALLITAIGQSDVPMVQTLTFMFAALIVVFNLIADVAYGLLDPRIRYD
ncbi:MAG: ABC transporter permease [Actinomycetes bacterium]|jgi:peptide/nickel transport system permease protein|nr:MAG: ABC transporter substrate-binding protein [Actinomycetota bacterium]